MRTTTKVPTIDGRLLGTTDGGLRCRPAARSDPVRA